MDKSVRITRKYVNKNLDLVYKTCRNIAKDWGKTTVPVPIIKTTIEKTKAPYVDDPDYLEWVKAYNNMLDTLYSACEKTSKSFNSKEVPVSIIKEYVQTVKKSFNSSLK